MELLPQVSPRIHAHTADYVMAFFARISKMLYLLYPVPSQGIQTTAVPINMFTKDVERCSICRLSFVKLENIFFK